MNIETTVTGPSTSAFLKELGVKFKTAYYWKNIGSGKFMLIPQTNVNPIVIKRKKNNKVKTKLKFIPSFIPAFSVGELGIIIPWGFFQKSIVFKMPGGCGKSSLTMAIPIVILQRSKPEPLISLICFKQNRFPWTKLIIRKNIMPYFQ